MTKKHEVGVMRIQHDIIEGHETGIRRHAVLFPQPWLSNPSETQVLWLQESLLCKLRGEAEETWVLLKLLNAEQSKVLRKNEGLETFATMSTVISTFLFIMT